MDLSAVDREVQVPRTLPPDTRVQIRRNLRTGAAAFGLLLALTVLMLFTPVFDGHIGGVGVGYIVGFLDFLIVLTIAAIHCVRSNRLDNSGEVE
ncbi:hypothetical protein [Rhodococcus sp. WAY2]|uniref:hypothetical protein n=1 Tax=Rhodococcus sp. WAY2 TaxID=2663121 RepID=UPI0013201FF5|nr:hypothetical protein [Rhodococcus sp. WAY2]QHE70968.1 hypothetical protein GFS60_04562 [Rhodococcus sp. WAY2]